MQKQILKTCLQNSTGKTLDFTFRTPLEHLNGSYLVNSVKTGRGKGGSLIVTMKNLESSEELSTVTLENKTVNFGTAVSDYIVNVTVDGTLFGPSSAEEDEENLPKNHEFAVKLRESLSPLLGKDGVKIQIDSKLPRLNGSWTMSGGIKSPGVFAQLKFDLLNDQGVHETLWTYRHSGVISDIKLIEE